MRLAKGGLGLYNGKYPRAEGVSSVNGPTPVPEKKLDACGARSLFFRRSLIGNNVDLFLAGSKRLELLSNQLDQLSIVVDAELRKISVESCFNLHQKYTILLETWYNYFIGVQDERLFVKSGIAYRRHHVKDPDNWRQFRDVFHDVDIMQDDYWAIVAKEKKLNSRTHEEMHLPNVKRNGERKVDHLQLPMWAMHLNRQEMESYLRTEDLIPVDVTLFINEAIQRIDAAIVVETGAVRVVEAALKDLQSRTAGREDGFSFLLQVLDRDADCSRESEAFFFAFGNASRCVNTHSLRSINNPELSRQMAVNETFPATIELCTAAEIVEFKSYKTLKAEAEEWRKHHNSSDWLQGDVRMLY